MSTTVNINFSKVQDTSNPVEMGTYPTIIKKFKLTSPKESSGYPYFDAQFEITDGEFAGRRLFCNLTTNPEETKNGSAKNYMLFDLLKILGLVDGPNEDFELDPEDVLNAEVSCTVKIEDYEDKNGDTKQKNTVTKFSPI